MSALFASGRVVDLILLLVTAEAVGLVALHRATGRGPAPAVLLPNLAAGACLLLALRFGVRGAAWPVVALCLLGSLVAHLTDLQGRWGRSRMQVGPRALPLDSVRGSSESAIFGKAKKPEDLDFAFDLELIPNNNVHRRVLHINRSRKHYMSTKLTIEQALGLGRPVEIDVQKSKSLPAGRRGSCQVNSGIFVKINPDALYCMGCAAGLNQEYEPHAWIKLGESYLECSPQDGVGHKYILVREMTYKELLKAVQDAGFDDRNGFIPPLLDASGKLVFLTPDDDASVAG